MDSLKFLPTATVGTAAVGALLAGSLCVWLFRWSGGVAATCLPFFGVGAAFTALGHNGFRIVMKHKSIREQLNSDEYGPITVRLFAYVFIFSVSFGVCEVLFFE